MTISPRRVRAPLLQLQDIFLEVYEKSWKSQFAEVGISYQHRLIDDMVSLCIKVRRARRRCLCFFAGLRWMFG